MRRQHERHQSPPWLWACRRQPAVTFARELDALAGEGNTLEIVLSDVDVAWETTRARPRAAVAARRWQFLR